MVPRNMVDRGLTMVDRTMVARRWIMVVMR